MENDNIIIRKHKDVRSKSVIPTDLKRENKYPALRGKKGQSLLQDFKKFVGKNKNVTHEKEVVLAFRVEQAKNTRDNFKEAYEKLSSKRNEVNSNGNELIAKLKSRSSLSIKDIETLSKFNRKPSILNLNNTFQSRANKEKHVSKNLNKQDKSLEREEKGYLKNFNKSERKLDNANKNLLKVQTAVIPSEKEASRQSQTNRLVGNSNQQENKPFVDKRFLDTYNLEQLSKNQASLRTSKEYSSYLKEQKSNLSVKLNSGQKLTGYEKVLVNKERDKPSLLNAYHIFTSKNGNIKSAIRNMNKEMENRSLMENNFKNRIERYSKDTDVRQPIDKLKTQVNPLEKYRHKAILKPHEIRNIKDFRTEQNITVSNSSGDIKQQAELNVKRADKLLERTKGSNEKIKEKNKEKEISINR